MSNVVDINSDDVKNPLDLLFNANKERVVKFEFDIPISEGNTIRAFLTGSDWLNMARDEEKIYQMALVDNIELGLGKRPINTIEWDAHVKGACVVREGILKAENEKLDKGQQKTTKQILKEVQDFRLSLNKKRPESLAHQVARNTTKDHAVLEFVPKYIKSVETKELLLSDYEKQEQFREIIAVNPEVKTAIYGAYLGLANKMREVNSKVKN